MQRMWSQTHACARLRSPPLHSTTRCSLVTRPLQSRARRPRSRAGASRLCPAPRCMQTSRLPCALLLRRPGCSSWARSPLQPGLACLACPPGAHRTRLHHRPSRSPVDLPAQPHVVHGRGLHNHLETAAQARPRRRWRGVHTLRAECQCHRQARALDRAQGSQTGQAVQRAGQAQAAWRGRAVRTRIVRRTSGNGRE
jgi:hypothetical protein